MSNKKNRYNGQEVEKQPLAKKPTVNHNGMMRGVLESSVGKKIAGDITAGIDSPIYLYSGYHPKDKMLKNRDGDVALRYFVEAQGFAVSTPRIQSGTDLMYKTVQHVNHVSLKTTHRKNPADLMTSWQRAMNAKEFISFDLETLSGIDGNGRARNDFITEVSLRHYTNMQLGSVGAGGSFDLTPNGKYTVNALLGLSDSDAKSVTNLLNGFLNKGKRFSDLTNREQVYIKELLKFSDAESGYNKDTGFKYVKRKLSTEDVDKLLLGSHESIARKVEQGIKFLHDNYDASAKSKVGEYFSGASSYVNANNGAMFLSANGITFDAPVIQKHFGTVINPSMQLDITELYQMQGAITGEVSRGGSTVSKMFEGIYGNTASRAHIADADTEMTAAIAASVRTKEALSSVMDYTNKNMRTVSVGDVFNLDTTVSSSLGFMTDGTVGIGSTGFFIDDGGEFNARSFDYGVHLSSNMPYALTGMREYEFDALPEDVKQSFLAHKGDAQLMTEKVHAVTLSPLYNPGITSKKQPYSSAEFQTTLFLTDSEYSSFVGGIGDRIGTVPLKQQGSQAQDVIDWSRVHDFTFSDIEKPDVDASTPEEKLSLNEYHKKLNDRISRSRIDMARVRTERAVRKYEDSYYKALRTYDFMINGSYDLELSRAYATGNQDVINIIEEKIASLLGKREDLGKIVGEDNLRYYHTTYEGVGHMRTLSKELHNLMPIYSAIEEELDSRNLTGVSREETFNRMFTDVLGSINYNVYGSDGRISVNALASNAGTYTLPNHRNQLTIQLSNEIVSPYRTTNSFTLNLDNPFDSFKIGDKLLRMSDINTDGMTENSVNFVKKDLINAYVRDAMADPTHGSDMRGIFSSLLEKNGNLKGLTDDSVTADDLSKLVFNTIKSSGIRTETVPVRNAHKVPNFKKNTVIRMNGAKIRNTDQLKTNVREFVRNLPNTISVDYSNSETYLDHIFEALVDSPMRSVDAYEKYLTDVAHIDSKSARARAILYGSTLDDYRSVIKDIISNYGRSGIDFNVENGQLVARDRSYKFVKLNLPELRAQNGIGYVRYGKKSVGLNYGLDFKGTGTGELETRFTSIFSDAMAPWKSARRSIMNSNGAVSIKSLMSDLSYRFSDVGDASDTAALNRAHMFTSGGTLNISNLAIRMFDNDNVRGASLDSAGALRRLKTQNPEIYNQLKSLYEKGTHQKSAPKSIAGISTEFYEVFHKYLPEITDSVASYFENDDVGFILPQLNSAETAEKLAAGDNIQIGRVAYSFEEGYGQKHRGTGVQVAKGQTLRADRLSKYGFKNINNILETEGTINNSVRRGLYDVDGLDVTTGFVAGVMHMNEDSYHEYISKYLTTSAGIQEKARIEAAYGKGSFETIMKAVVKANVQNDGSILMDNASLAMSTDRVNNVYENIVGRSIRVTDKRSNKKVINDARDFIPSFTIDKETGAVSVKFKDGFYAKQGDSLSMMNKETGLIETKLLKRNFVGNIAFINDQKIELTAGEVSELLNKMSGVSHIINSGLSDSFKFEAIANELYRQYGIRSQLVMHNVARHNKGGFGEEKTLFNSLSLALGATEQSRNILDKYNVAARYGKSIYGTIVTDEFLDFMAKDTGMSADEVAFLRRTIASPTELVRRAIGDTTESIAAISNTNFTKHGSIAQTVSSMLESIRRADSKTYSKLVKDVFGKTATITDTYTLINDVDEINVQKIKDTFDKLGLDPNISYQRLVSMDDWEAKKYAGEIENLKANIIASYRNGDITLREATSKIADIESRAEDNLGTLFGQREYNILARNYMSTDSMSDILYGTSDDISLERVRKRLVGRGIIQGSGSEYVLAGKYARGTTSFLQHTLDNLGGVMRTGTENDLKLIDYIRDGYTPHEYKDLIEKYKGDSRFQNYTPDKLDSYDTYKRYEDVLKFNTKPSSRNISDSTVINAANLEIATEDNAKYVTRSALNPYTNDVVIDLGEDFYDNRYLKTLGTTAKFTANGTLVKNDYQKQYSRLRDLVKSYNDIKEGTMSDDRLEAMGLSKVNDPLKYLKEQILSTRNAIMDAQGEFASGKKSLATDLISMRSRISGTLESQTISAVKLENLLGFDITKDFEFEDMKLSEHVKNKRLVDYAVISRSSAERMGLYDENFMSKHIDFFKKHDADAYNAIIKELGDGADNEAIMDKILRTQGIGGFLNRYPSIQRESMMTSQLYVSDNIGDDTILLNEYTQRKMKNDNDSDKVSFSIMDYDSIDYDEVSASTFAASSRNYRDELIEAGKLGTSKYDIDKIISSTAIDGKIYKNISDIDQYVSIKHGIKEGKYGDAFASLYTADRSEFDKHVSEYMNQYGLGQDFVDIMNNDYVSQRLLDQYDLAAQANISKNKVGIANNSVENLVDVGTGYIDTMLNSDSLDEEAMLRYRAAREISLDVRGSLIEDTINAKNTADTSAVNRVSNLVANAKTLLRSESNSDRVAAAEEIAQLINAVGSSRIESKIDANLSSDAAMRGSSVIQYLRNKGIDAATAEGKAQAVDELSHLYMDIIQESDVKTNATFINRKSVGYSGSGARKTTDAILDYGDLYSDIYSGKITDTFERAEFSASETAERIRGTNVDLGSSSKTAQYIKQGVNAILSNVTGKSLAVGALGLAAGLMTVGFIGGNPSSAPQEDADRMTYTQDNYDYESGTVMPPPMPQVPKNGYVINMRGSTTGSYSAARGNMVQAVQQSYVPNMNVNVRQNFSYSSYEDNDRYVENLIRDLI